MGKTGKQREGNQYVLTSKLYVRVGPPNQNFKAIAYKAGTGDSNETQFTADNSGIQSPQSGSAGSSTAIVFSVWDGDWALLAEYGTENTLLESYVQGLHGLVKTVVSNIYYYQDSLGSTSHIADSTGHLLESYRYDLYGAPKYFAADGTPLPNGSANNVRDLFTGQRWMPELGLYDDRNRFMSPDLGRFLQPDPIGFKGDASNLYRYCGNDWANRTDPMGLGPNITDNEAGTMEDNQGTNGAHQGGASHDIAKAEVASQVSVDAHHVEMMASSRGEALAAAHPEEQS